MGFSYVLLGGIFSLAIGILTLFLTMTINNDSVSSEVKGGFWFGFTCLSIGLALFFFKYFTFGFDNSNY